MSARSTQQFPTRSVRTTTRRAFVQTAGASLAATWALSELPFLRQLPAVRADETAPAAGNVVQFRPEIEPLVRLLEDTPRNKLLEEVAQRIKKGLSYREVLAALFLASVRNIQPRPSVGFKFHGVLVVNSAHVASVSSPDEHRWLPIFWTLDHFKATQAQDAQEGNWTMPPVKEDSVPGGDKARSAFIAAMDNWDEAAADTAVAGLARTAGGSEVFELLFRYGARDFRSIGHKAIFVANSWRTLNVIGLEHSEGVLRSLAYALQNHQGESNPATSDLAADQPWRKNLERAKKLRADWTTGKLSAEATREMLKALHSASADDCCELAVELINGGADPQSIWDALFLGGGELLFRQRGIVALHALTTANALRFAYDTSGVDETRKLMLLQCAAFVPLFRGALGGRGKVEDVDIQQLEATAVKASGREALDEIFGGLNGDRKLTATKVLGARASGVSAEDLIQAGRVLIFKKGNDAHAYKFSTAVLEDYYKVSPEFRDRFLAAGIFNMHGSSEADMPLLARINSAFA